MKKLFLASIAAYTIEKFISFFDIDPKKSAVAFIPTASTIYPDWSPIEDRNKLIELGFQVKDVHLENKNKAQLLNEMEGIGIIFVAGGNTFYLLQEVRKSKFDEVIIDLVGKGIPYIGSSAGALLVGPSVELALDIDNQNEAPELPSYDALNLVDFVVLPHYDDERFQCKVDENLEKMKDIPYQTIKITEHQAVLIHGEDVQIV